LRKQKVWSAISGYRGAAALNIPFLRFAAAIKLHQHLECHMRIAPLESLDRTLERTGLGAAPLLQDTAGLLRGYGNIFSLSLRGRWEIVPRFSIDPRIGTFFWDTKETATGGGMSVSDTHQGGGVTAGVGWRFGRR
jgi:hypothetical protein